MRINLLRSTFLLMLALMFSGCATIIKTPRQIINVSTQPNNAKVVVYDNDNMVVWSGETPSAITLNKGKGYFKGATYRLEISKPGYQKMSLELKPTINGGWYLGGNILLGGLIGWIVVDPITGAMWLLDPQNLSVQLSSYDLEHSGNLKVVMLNEIDPNLLTELPLQRIN